MKDLSRKKHFILLSCTAVWIFFVQVKMLNVSLIGNDVIKSYWSFIADFGWKSRLYVADVTTVERPRNPGWENSFQLQFPSTSIKNISLFVNTFNIGNRSPLSLNLEKSSNKIPFLESWLIINDPSHLFREVATRNKPADLLLLFCNFVVKANFMPNEQCH